MATVGGSVNHKLKLRKWTKVFFKKKDWPAQCALWNWLASQLVSGWMFLAIIYSLLACFTVSPVLRVSSWKCLVWCLPSLGYSPPSFTNFIIQIQAPCFCQGNLFRPALPASLLLADDSLPSNPCFMSIHLCCPEFSWLSQPSVSPCESLSTFSPNSHLSNILPRQ